jgi:hypothetical protein
MTIVRSTFPEGEAMRALVRAILVGGLAAGALLPATAASASDPVTRSGQCSGPSPTTWTLRAAEAAGDQARIIFTVDSPVANRTWAVRMTRNGNQFFAGQRTTGPNGNFTVSTLGPEINNVADTYVATARNLTSGVVCRGQATLPA